MINLENIKNAVGAQRQGSNEVFISSTNIQKKSDKNKISFEKINELKETAIKTAEKTIAESVDGGKHFALYKASYLLGGYVGGGILTEYEAINELRRFIDNKANVTDLKAAYQTIDICLQKGKKEPITPEAILENRQKYCERFNYSDYQYTKESKKDEQGDEPINALNFSNDIYNNLPDFLKECCNPLIDKNAIDVFLLTSLTCISAILPNFYGIYDNKKVYPNLYTFIIGKASSGKGIMDFAGTLIESIDDAKNKELKELIEIYKFQLALFKENPINKEPTKPQKLMLKVGANNSGANFVLSLKANPKGLLMFENEGDSLNETLKKEYGNYSDVMRKSFHHEEIIKDLKEFDEPIRLKDTKLSVALTGTPDQYFKLVPSPENGLHSRFMLYVLKTNLEWRNPFKNKDFDFESFYQSQSAHLLNLYNHLELRDKRESILFQLTEKQQNELNLKFEKWQKELYTLYGDECIASIRRLGLILFRICMIFSIIREIKNNYTVIQEITCIDADFYNGLSIIEILINHSKYIFNEFEKRFEKNKSNPKSEITEKDVLLFTREKTGHEYKAILEFMKSEVNENTYRSWIKRK